MLGSRPRPPAGLIRALGAAIGAFTVLVLLASPASAVVTGGCRGTATIEGQTYTPANDTEDNPVVLPDKAGVVATYTGSQPAGGKNHRGGIAVQLGPGRIAIASWGNPNKGGDTRAEGTYALDQLHDKVGDIVGIFRVTGFHRARNPRVDCTGFVMVQIEGNPLTTPAGGAAAGVTALSAGGLLAAAMTRKGLP